jgi:hypothetical protein
VNNQAPELSPEARRLIDEARGTDDPTAEDHARVKARWLASVAAVAGVSSLTEAARAAGTISWGFKAAGAALVIAAGAIGLNFMLDADDSAEAKKPVAPLPGGSSVSGGSLPGAGNSHERFQKTARARHEGEKLAVSAKEPGPFTADPVPGAAAPALQPIPSAEPVEPAQARVTEAELPVPAATGALAVSQVAGPEGAVPQGAVPQGAVPQAVPQQAAVPQAAVRAKPPARAAVARAGAPKAVDREAPSVPSVEASPAAAGSPAAAEPSGQLSEELALLSDVRSSIQGGAAVRALDLLSRYETRFGQPILGMEADALRVDALCKAGQREAARESARVFQSEWPGSPLERRVSAACP